MREFNVLCVPPPPHLGGPPDPAHDSGYIIQVRDAQDDWRAPLGAPLRLTEAEAWADRSCVIDWPDEGYVLL